MKEGKRWLVVVAYSVAMAWVEAAVVFYLRTMLGRIEPHQANPLPMVGSLGVVELMRELATLMMLFTVGVLAGRTWRSRFGYMCVAFGFWDIFYYVFLKLMCGWPHSPLDWDILFLIPVPWWGPVLAPVIIAVLMIIWGTLASQFDQEIPFNCFEWKSILPGFAGTVLALYAFMADAILVAAQGSDAVRHVLPEEFAWGWFSVAAILMSIPVVHLVWKVLWRGLNCARPVSPQNPAGEAVRPELARTFSCSPTIIE